jgi:hypothetical protein
MLIKVACLCKDNKILNTSETTCSKKILLLGHAIETTLWLPKKIYVEFQVHVNTCST